MIDRDKILVPANWDSWGKIRIIREGFDMEGVSTAWSIEIQEPPEPLNGASDSNKADDPASKADDGTSAVAIYEQTIRDPKRDTSIGHGSRANANKIEIETEDMQTFLAKQLEVLEKLKLEDEKDRAARKVPKPELATDESGRVNEHIGPVQFNMGGIQVDADDMLRKLKVSQASNSELFFHLPVHTIGQLTRLCLSTGERGQPRPEEGNLLDHRGGRKGAQPGPGELLRRLGQEACRQ